MNELIEYSAANEPAPIGHAEINRKRIARMSHFVLHGPAVRLALPLLMGLLLGCADENAAGRFVLSGTVTYDGEPISKGTIEFFPAAGNSGKPAGAEIIDGRYEVERTIGPELGKYQVVIRANRPSGRKVPADEGSSELVDLPVQYIPPMYNTRSTLETEVTGDQADLSFNLEKPKRSRRRR